VSVAVGRGGAGGREKITVVVGVLDFVVGGGRWLWGFGVGGCGYRGSGLLVLLVLHGLEEVWQELGHVVGVDASLGDGGHRCG